MESKYFLLFLVSVILFSGCLGLERERDISICEKIPNQGIKEECYRLVGEYQTDGIPEPENDIEPEGKVDIYFFYNPTCPHCAREKAFLEELEKKHQEAEIHYLLVSESWKFFEEMCESHNTTTAGVPRTFIGDKAFIGFSPKDCDLNFYKGYGAYVGCPNQIEEAIR